MSDRLWMEWLQTDHHVLCAAHLCVKVNYEHFILCSSIFFISFSAGEKELVVLGDFGSPPQSSELDILRKEKLCALVPFTQFTNISTRSPQGTRCLDNIWVSRSLKKIYSGRCTNFLGVLLHLLCSAMSHQLQTEMSVQIQLLGHHKDLKVDLLSVKF